MANLIEASDTPNSIEEDSGRSALALASSSFSEAPRKKVKTTATFPNNPRVIHKDRKRFNGGLTISKNRDSRERSIVAKDPLSGLVNGLHLCLKHAAVED